MLSKLKTLCLYLWINMFPKELDKQVQILIFVATCISYSSILSLLIVYFILLILFSIYYGIIRKSINRYKLRKTIIIGFTGKKGSGKSTAVEALKDEFGGVEYSLAGTLKVVCKELFNLTDKQVTDPIQKERIDDRIGISPRVIMQRIGNEFRTYIPNLFPEIKFNHTLWLNIFDEYLKNTNDRIIWVPDVRYEDECAFIKDKGGYIIHIYRNRNMQSIEDVTSQHTSENQDLSRYYNRIIMNYYSKEYFIKECKTVIGSMLVNMAK